MAFSDDVVQELLDLAAGRSRFLLNHAY